MSTAYYYTSRWYDKISDYMPSSVQFDLESEEYSLEKEIKEILHKPLVDILVALMLINDIFLYLQNKII